MNINSRTFNSWMKKNQEKYKNIEEICINFAKYVLERENNGDTWKNNLEIYLQEEFIAYAKLISDKNYILERQRYHPKLNILLSLEKAHKDFWGTEEGWKYKKKKKASNINWKSTFSNSLSMRFNQVWQNNEETPIKSGISLPQSMKKT